MTGMTRTAERIHTVLPSPIGELLIVGAEAEDGLVLASVTLPGPQPEPAVLGRAATTPFTGIAGQLDAYFSGDLKEFSYAVLPTGTVFQREVWAALDVLPYGMTTTYGRLNASLGGSPARARAIGRAIGANPLLILRPCHRVVGSDGSLTGFAAGLPAKRALLTLEGVLL